jgi:hypothetical protein
MMRAIRGVFRRGRIIPVDPVPRCRESEVIITFLDGESPGAFPSRDVLMDRFIGKGKGRGADAAENHDAYLYGKGKK